MDRAAPRGVIARSHHERLTQVPVPSYRFKARADLPDLGLVEGECLLITPGDAEYPLVATHPIDITPAQFFDAVMAGTLQPDQCPHDGSANPIYAIRNAMKWPWQQPLAAEDAAQDGELTQDEAVDALYHAAMRVLPEPTGGESGRNWPSRAPIWWPPSWSAWATTWSVLNLFLAGRKVG